MKKIILAFMLLGLPLYYAGAHYFVEVNTMISAPLLQWKQTGHDFGKIKRDQPVRHTFEFTNTGNAPLTILGASTSCGCTASEYTKEAIAPGKTGFIHVTFNAATPGVFSKTITVMSNVPASPTVLTIQGEVVL